MADQALAYALSTVARIKARLAITEIGFDTVFISYLNAATDFIESSCDRRFKETTYADEVYSVDEYGMRQLVLKQFPVSSLTKFQYRAGLPSNPSWTDFQIDSYQLREDGATGIIAYDGDLPKGINTVRASYVAGYKIDFTKYGDIANHTLPADITELCERLIVKRFKRREAEGKMNESFGGGSIAWQDLLEDSDKDILAGYRRIVFI
jgi:hypothetical protein